MEKIDIFKETLTAILEMMPRGSKSKLADDLSISRVNLSGYLSGKDNFSEHRKGQIAEYLGYSYADFLHLGARLFQSDDPWLWALRFIYQDKKRFAELIEESGIPEHRFDAIFDDGRAIPLMPDEKPQILDATGFTEEEFIKLGQREILKTPKKKWDLGGKTNPINTGVGIGWKNKGAIENQTNEHPRSKGETMSEPDLLDAIKRLLDEKLEPIKAKLSEIENRALSVENYSLKEFREIDKKISDLYYQKLQQQQSAPQPEEVAKKQHTG